MESNFVCSFCGYQTDRRDNMKRHLKNKKFCGESDLNQEEREEIIKKIFSVTKLIRCKFCNATFNSERTYRSLHYKECKDAHERRKFENSSNIEEDLLQLQEELSKSQKKIAELQRKINNNDKNKRKKISGEKREEVIITRKSAPDRCFSDGGASRRSAKQKEIQDLENKASKSEENTKIKEKLKNTNKKSKDEIIEKPQKISTSEQKKRISSKIKQKEEILNFEDQNTDDELKEESEEKQDEEQDDESEEKQDEEQDDESEEKQDDELDEDSDKETDNKSNKESDDELEEDLDKETKEESDSKSNDEPEKNPNENSKIIFDVYNRSYFTTLVPFDIETFDVEKFSFKRGNQKINTPLSYFHTKLFLKDFNRRREILFELYEADITFPIKLFCEFCNESTRNDKNWRLPLKKFDSENYTRFNSCFKPDPDSETFPRKNIWMFSTENVSKKCIAKEIIIEILRQYRFWYNYFTSNFMSSPDYKFDVTEYEKQSPLNKEYAQILKSKGSYYYSAFNRLDYSKEIELFIKVLDRYL